MAGLVELGRTFLPGVGDRLDQLAHNLVLETNRVHSTGIPLGGSFARSQMRSLDRARRDDSQQFARDRVV